MISNPSRFLYPGRAFCFETYSFGRRAKASAAGQQHTYLPTQFAPVLSGLQLKQTCITTETPELSTRGGSIPKLEQRMEKADIVVDLWQHSCKSKESTAWFHPSLTLIAVLEFDSKGTRGGSNHQIAEDAV